VYAHKDGGVGRPTAGYLSASPNPVAAGDSLTLRANELRAAPGRAIQSVSFYLDANADGVADSTELVGTDTNGSDGWSLATPTGPIADYTYLAVAVDSTGVLSNTVAAPVSVRNPQDIPPTLSVSDASVVEGAADTGTELVFTVTRSGDTSQEATVAFATADGTATASSDYAPVSGTLIFGAGETTVVVRVPVEPNETVVLVLSNPVGATIADGTGVGTIVNDDLPRLNISNATKLEGRNGVTSFTFTVTLSAPSATEVRVWFATQDGTAPDSIR